MKKTFHSVLLCTLCTTLIFLSGCTPKAPLNTPEGNPSLTLNVPFIPPRTNLCASTSIEMVSQYWQENSSFIPHLSANQIDRRTLIPEKGGTLQIELKSTARANGLIVYPLPPNLEALLRAIKSGYPTIVLVNRAYSWYPLWHYAPVTGYDSYKQTISLHFSDLPHEQLTFSTFRSLWKRSGNWGVILLPPQKIPKWASPDIYLHAVYELEKTALLNDAIIAYRYALKRWPDNTNILFALGNVYYASNQFKKAEKMYKRILSLKPYHPLTLNNLADLLCRMNQKDEALQTIQKAKSDDQKIKIMLESTYKEINIGCK